MTVKDPIGIVEPPAVAIFSAEFAQTGGEKTGFPRFDHAAFILKAVPALVLGVGEFFGFDHVMLVPFTSDSRVARA